MPKTLFYSYHADIFSNFRFYLENLSPKIEMCRRGIDQLYYPPLRRIERIFVLAVFNNMKVRKVNLNPVKNRIISTQQP